MQLRRGLQRGLNPVLVFSPKRHTGEDRLQGFCVVLLALQPVWILNRELDGQGSCGLTIFWIFPCPHVACRSLGRMFRYPTFVAP